ncbi:MAG: zinc-binding dehydrogenase [Chitinophagaceae bacterium]|nr:zinc-binding dehydrogenase [Chitinophagaceae bacterium]
MKALVLGAKNAPLSLQERPDLQAGDGEAIVQVRAAALNHRDVWIQKGQYAGLKYPIIPGSDGAGVVVNADPAGASWVGKEVIINPAFNWGNDPSHQHPRDFRILGLPNDGTFAEYVKVPLQNLVEKPAHLSFEEAAALPLAGVTAYRAIMTRAQLQPDEKVLITGIGGGVALFALQYAVALGARVYVTSGSQEKIDRAIALGALGGANYQAGNWGQNLQEQAGSFDVIVDGAAGDGMDELLNLATPGGRVVFYGATRGNPSNITARRIFWKQLNVLGSTMGDPDDFRSMVAFVDKHRIQPVVDTVFPFADGEAAFRHMDDAKQFGKIVIKIR